MRTLAIGTFVALALAACGSSKDSDSTGGSATGSATGTVTGTATGTTGGTTTFSVTTSWTDAGDADTIDIVIVDPLGVTAWDFGMVEDASVSSNPWTGEDCLAGYGSFAYCHPIGVNHTLTQTLDLPLTEGSETLFDSSKDPYLTYYLADAASCFVWGADVAYYSSLGCDELM